MSESLPASAHWRSSDATENPSRAADPISVLQRTWGTWRLSLDCLPLQADELTTRYDRVAGTWMRRLEHLGVPAAYARLLRDLLTDGALRTLPDDAWVLDAGTGTGALSVALATQHRIQQRGDQLMFSAVDRSSAMLQVARAEFDAARIDVALRRADVGRLPFDDGTFDLVMAGHVVEHVCAPGEAIRELARVLRPGAPLLLLTTRRSLLGALVQLRWRVHRFGMQELKALLGNAGFEDIRFVPISGAPWNRHLSLVCTARKTGRTARNGISALPALPT